MTPFLTVALLSLATTVGIAGTHFLLIDAAPVIRMVALIVVLMAGVKALVYTRSRQRLSLGSYLLFAGIWPGMRPEVFAARRPHPHRTPIVWTALTIPAGIALIHFAGDNDFALLAGFCLTFHLGFLALLTRGVQLAGYPARALFRNPLAARTLDDFWSRRWNLGFVEMTSSLVYRPLRRKIGAPAAGFASFLFSGLVHEVAITLPAQAGYGLPTAYFALHGVAVAVEKRFVFPPLGARIWTFALLVVPLPLLFPKPFIDGCLRPLVASF